MSEQCNNEATDTDFDFDKLVRVPLIDVLEFLHVALQGLQLTFERTKLSPNMGILLSHLAH